MPAQSGRHDIQAYAGRGGITLNHHKFQFVEQTDNSKQTMIQNYKIVTLCGSTRFKEQFMEVQKRLTLEGYIVISVGLFGHSGDEARHKGDA